MIKLHDPDERREYEALLTAVLAEAEGTGERVAHMDALIEDAVQAQRQWATQVEESCRRVGYSNEIKDYLKRTRVVIAIDTRKVSKPRTIGAKATTPGGKVIDLQLDFEVMTFDQLRDKRREYLKQITAYKDLLAFANRLLDLADAAPGTDTPQDAAQALGLDLEEYLARTA